METIALLIQKIRVDKKSFDELIHEMTPLINKYVYLLYKDEQDDVRAEMILALWEAVSRIKYCENDKECLSYISRALRNRFYELYRKSRKQYDNRAYEEYEENMQDEPVITDINNIEFHMDIEKFIDEFGGNKKELYKAIILEQKSDIEIGQEHQLSRQYVNRIRNTIYKELRDFFNM